MNAQNYMADQLERLAESYSQFLESTEVDRLQWKPELAGASELRTILEQVSECVAVNIAVAALLRGEPVPPMTDTPVPESATIGRSMLQTSAAELAAEFRALTDEDLTKVYPHPKAQILGSNLLMMPLRNMAYHCGQLNLFQMLYGDAEFHAPTNWR